MNLTMVDRKALLLLGGIIWTAVGLALCAAAVYWLATTGGDRILPLAAGMIAGTFVYYFGFLRLVKKNMIRINELAPGKNKVCLFAFQSWRSYTTIIIMMAMGYFLRHLAVSRLYLVPIYLAIGIGLFLASLHYYFAA
jgi:hypothetical protein